MANAPGFWPVWMPDGTRLLYTANDNDGPDATRDLMVMRADGSGAPHRLGELRGAIPGSVSPDGRRLAVTQLIADAQRDIAIVPLSGHGERLSAGDSRVLVGGPDDDVQPAFSPTANGSPTRQERRGRSQGTYRIIVLAVDNPASRWEISTTNGYMPRWSPAARELFFFHFDDRERAFNVGLRVASYSAAERVFAPGAVRPFAADVRWAIQGAAPIYTISGDGNRVVGVVDSRREEDGSGRPPHVVMLNLFDEIRRKARASAR
jgi:hypothetical protein